MEVGLDMPPVATIGVDSTSTNLGEQKGLVSQISKMLIEHGTQQHLVVAARCSHHTAHNATKKGDEAMSGLCMVVSVQAGGARSWAFRTWDLEARAVRVHDHSLVAWGVRGKPLELSGLRWGCTIAYCVWRLEHIQQLVRAVCKGLRAEGRQAKDPPRTLVERLGARSLPNRRHTV
jgi:hypothetical protein